MGYNKEQPSMKKNITTELELHDRLRRYIEKFNKDDNEIYQNHIPNEKAYDWMLSHIPLIDIPDKEIEAVYYFRWWTFRKHIKKTEQGFVISEFLPSVPWAGKYNSISAACGHHVKEGRWLRYEETLDHYIRYWYQESDNLNSYSHWLEYVVYELCRQRKDFSLALVNLDGMIRWYKERERTNYREDVGLFWSLCDRDAMEFSISGDGFRLPLNTYMCANARAIFEFARIAGRNGDAEVFLKKSEDLSANIEKFLWCEKNRFYICVYCPNKDGSGDFERKDHRFVAREPWGYNPWYFKIAPEGREDAFSQLADNAGFYAPFGLTTAEQRHSGYGCFYTGEELNHWLLARGQNTIGPIGHECLWNGPVWPFATSFALTALIESKRPDDGLFFHLLKQYANSHRLVPNSDSPYWIDEVMHPQTGDWISRTRLKEWSGNKFFDEKKGGKERGKDYNHSSFCDLIISGLFGVKVDSDDIIVKPRFPDDWENAIMYHIPYAGKLYTIKYTKPEISVEIE